MFIDRVKLELIGGNGGNGIVSFRREKFVAKGGPDGGDGGRGGSVILRVDPQLSTLMDLRYKNVIKAQRGAHGMGAKKTGRSGEDTIVRIPPGTLVINDETGEQIADLTENGEEYIIAPGGKPGKGNIHFATSVKQTPRKATEGKPGTHIIVRFELKLLADVGLVGLPNAGKSTLLSRVSAARPEIANYPFTTLTPHLGIVQASKYESFVMADIPGLIEGAAEGKGLGHQFLRHVERTKVLAILIDSSEEKPKKVLETLLGELGAFNPDMLNRPQIIIRTKTDVVDEKWDFEDHAISAVTGDGIDQLVYKLAAMVKESKSTNEEEILSTSDFE